MASTAKYREQITAPRRTGRVIEGAGTVRITFGRQQLTHSPGQSGKLGHFALAFTITRMWVKLSIAEYPAVRGP